MPVSYELKSKMGCMGKRWCFMFRDGSINSYLLLVVIEKLEQERLLVVYGDQNRQEALQQRRVFRICKQRYKYNSGSKLKNSYLILIRALCTFSCYRVCCFLQVLISRHSSISNLLANSE